MAYQPVACVSAFHAAAALKTLHESHQKCYGEGMKNEALAAMFADLMQKHFGATMVSVPSPTPEQIAEMERQDAELAAMTDDEIVALWEAADETYCCDDIYAEGQRRGLGDRVCI